MIRLSTLVAGLLVLSATGSAFAQDDTKIKLGLRLGYAVPSGKTSGNTTVDGITVSGAKLSDSISGQVPVWIDAGYMVTPNILVGLYGQYGSHRSRTATRAPVARRTTSALACRASTTSCRAKASIPGWVWASAMSLCQCLNQRKA
jgi:hypothetical protein